MHIPTFARSCVLAATVLLLAVSPGRFAGAQGPGDPERGREVFLSACQPCHDAKPGSHQVGPSLSGVVGRKVGTADGYRRYSAALKQADAAWTPERLERYLSDPKAMFPGQRKRYDGLQSRQDRVDLIAYLRQLTGG